MPNNNCWIPYGLILPVLLMVSAHDDETVVETVLPMIIINIFIGFGANFARDVTSDVRNNTAKNQGRTTYARYHA